MIKTLLIGLLALHGLIHVLGTITAFDLMEIEDFTGKTLFSISDTTKMVLGVVWSIVMIMFFISAYGLYEDLSWWRNLAIASVIFSQILVTIWWADAKFGTVANILIIAALIYDDF